MSNRIRSERDLGRRGLPHGYLTVEPRRPERLDANLSDAFLQMPAGAQIKVAFLVSQARLEGLITAESHHGVWS